MTPSSFDDWRAVASAAVGAYLVLISWLGRRQLSRLDAMEERQKQMVTRSELERYMREMREEFRSEIREQRRALQDVHFDIKLILLDRCKGHETPDAVTIKRRIDDGTDSQIAGPEAR